MQFHPTALAVNTEAGNPNLPLLTEALRGAGALLVDDAGERFMTSVHAAAEASRYPLLLLFLGDFPNVPYVIQSVGVTGRTIQSMNETYFQIDLMANCLIRQQQFCRGEPRNRIIRHPAAN